MYQIVLWVHLLLCLILVGLVLVQQGKGADLGAALGGGSNSIFGAGGATSLIVKITTGVAIAFMCTSILLVNFSKELARGSVEGDILEGSVVSRTLSAPAETGTSAEQESSVESAAQPEAKPLTSPDAEVVAAPIENDSPVEQNSTADQ